MCLGERTTKTRASASLTVQASTVKAIDRARAMRSAGELESYTANTPSRDQIAPMACKAQESATNAISATISCFVICTKFCAVIADARISPS